MIIGKKEFTTGTHIMGILNVTEDSFYEPSRLKNDLIERVYCMIRDGAEIIDIGGQSTRPGAEVIKSPVELGRVLPVLKEIKKHFDIPVSIDTFYSNVADVCLDNGADMINDVTCFSDPKMAKVIANHNASVCICHNRRNSPKDSKLIPDIIDGLQKAIDKARGVGIRKEQIILDGGIGFNHNPSEDWELLLKYGQLKQLGYPLLLGTSRKSFLGGEVEDRLNATVNTTALATKKGYLFVRVHDIAENKAAIDALSYAMEKPAEPETEEKKGVSLYDLVTDVESGTKKVDLEQSDIMADEQPQEEQPAEETKEEVVEETTEEVQEVPQEETQEEVAEEEETQDIEAFKEEVRKKVDYKPGRGLPMRDDIKISRFGSDDDTDYSTY